MRLKRVCVLKIGEGTSFAHDEGVQGVVQLVDFGYDAARSTLRYMRLVLKDILACDRAVVAAAGLDPDDTHERFMARIAGTSAPLAWKIDVVLYGEWSFARISVGDVCWVRGKGLVVRPNSSATRALGDHPFELVVPQDSSAVELENVGFAGSYNGQPTYDGVADVLTLKDNAVTASRVPIQRRVDLDDATTRPLASIDHGEACVLGVIVGQLLPSQTRTPDMRSVLYIVDESRPLKPTEVVTFRLPTQDFPLGRMGDIIQLHSVEAKLHMKQVTLEVKKKSSWTLFSRDGVPYTGERAATSTRMERLVELSRQRVMRVPEGPVAAIAWPMQNKVTRLALAELGSTDLCVRVVAVKQSAEFSTLLLVSDSAEGDEVHGLIHVTARPPSYALRLRALGALTPGACVMVRAVNRKEARTREAEALGLRVEYFANSGDLPGAVATSFMVISALPSPLEPVAMAAAPRLAAVTAATAAVEAPQILALWRCAGAVTPIAEACRAPVLSVVALCGRVAWQRACGADGFVIALEDDSGRAIVAASDETARHAVEQLVVQTNADAADDLWANAVAHNHVWLFAKAIRLQHGFCLVGAAATP